LSIFSIFVNWLYHRVSIYENQTHARTLKCWFSINRLIIKLVRRREKKPPSHREKTSRGMF